MLWYLLKTWSGREEELVKEIRRTVPPYMYHEAFVIYNERVWRRQGKNILHLEPLFKGCVFLSCRKTQPLFQRLELVPAMQVLMAAGSLSVFPLTEEDVEFLKQISGEDHVIRLSYVIKQNEKEQDVSAYRVSGPLENCLDDIESIEFRKRFAKIKRKLWGEEQVIAMGIILNEDTEQKLFYENLEFFSEAAENSRIMEIAMDAQGRKIYREQKSLICKSGEKRRISIIPGDFESQNKTMENPKKAIG